MNVKNVVFLDKAGKITRSLPSKLPTRLSSLNTFPIVTENYLWDNEKQTKSAEKYKDQIKRVFYMDEVAEETKVMLQDDLRRIELVKTFNYGKSVLEVGCSDGTVSLKIAELPKVKKVVGVDIRSSAIQDAKRLVKDLLKRKELSAATAKKVSFVHFATENLPARYGQFDSVCAYEIFEHLAPQDLIPVFQNLHGFIEKKGNFFLSVPNRFPNPKYDRLGRSRWQWYDHRNFFSELSLRTFLLNFFESVTFYPLYPNEKIEDSIYLICECRGKK